MRLKWTKPDPSDPAAHHWTKFGPFTGSVFRERGEWGARIGLRLHCVIHPRRLNSDTFTTPAAAKSWVRATAETLGLFRDA